jgi:hypothetical protein
MPGRPRRGDRWLNFATMKSGPYPGSRLEASIAAPCGFSIRILIH